MLSGTKDEAVSCAPYLVSRSHGIAEFPSSQLVTEPWYSGSLSSLLFERNEEAAVCPNKPPQLVLCVVSLALGVRRVVPANQPLGSRFFR